VLKINNLRIILYLRSILLVRPGCEALRFQELTVMRERHGASRLAIARDAGSSISEFRFDCSDPELPPAMSNVVSSLATSLLLRATFMPIEPWVLSSFKAR
jgi:hypothetical protein